MAVWIFASVRWSWLASKGLMGKDQICIPFRVTQMAHMGWGRGGGNFPSSEGIKQEQKPSPSPFFTGARSREPAPSAHSRSCQVLGGPVQRGGGGGGGCGSPGCSRGKVGCVRGSPFPEGPLPLASREQEVKAGGANPRQGGRGSERPGALTAALRWLSATFQRNWRPCILEATTCRLVPLGRGPGSDLTPSSGHNHIGTKF